MQIENWILQNFKVNSISEFVYSYIVPAVLCFYIGFSAQSIPQIIQTVEVEVEKEDREPASVEEQGIPKQVLDSSQVLNGKSAIKEIRELLKEYPGDADLYNNLASQYSNLKKYKSADKYFRKALNIEKAHPEATFNSAVLYEKQRRWKKSLSMYEKYLKENPTTPHKNAIKARIRTLNSLAASKGQRRTW